MTPIETFPEPWRQLMGMLAAPAAWVYPLQQQMLNAVWLDDPLLYKRLFILMPVLAAMVGMWCSLLCAYSLPFRYRRTDVVAAFLVLWWDLARSVWLFWAGTANFIFVLGGAAWGVLRIAAAAVKELVIGVIELPGALTGGITRNLLQGGIPWIAVGLTVFWAVLEATIFTYVLTPMVGEVLSDIVGQETHRFLPPLLFMMLLLMILGSFACMHVLVEAVQARNVGQIIQMLVVEAVVVMVEVAFLYRELVDALTPWIAQQTGVQMTLVPVIAFSTCGWFGVRAMTWFLFGRYGTPTFLALISRQRLPEGTSSNHAHSAADERWQKLVHHLKKEQEWFQEQGHRILEAAILPAFQLIAAALNFCFVLCLSKPLFSLPFKSLSEVGDTKALLQHLHAISHPTHQERTV